MSRGARRRAWRRKQSRTLNLHWIACRLLRLFCDRKTEADHSLGSEQKGALLRHRQTPSRLPTRLGCKRFSALSDLKPDFGLCFDAAFRTRPVGAAYGSQDMFWKWCGREDSNLHGLPR